MREGTGKGGAVICHPHPLYGGSMQNSIVEAIEEGFYRSGFSTLRFNFRGVGGSTGHYDDGNGETSDLVAACSFLRGRVKEGKRFVVAGYSFGAWVSARALAEIGDQVDLFLVAYPFSAYPADKLLAFRGRIYLVGGSLDDVSPLDDLLSFYKKLNCEKYLKVIPSSHFFDGREKEILDFVLENFGKEKG